MHIKMVSNKMGKKENIISRIMHWEFFKASHISDKHSKLDIIYLKFYVSY